MDATFGRGGHTRALLARLGPSGRVLALDRDIAAVDVARAIDDPRLAIAHAAFSQLGEAVRDAVGRWPPAAADIEGAGGSVDGVLFDLGVSSPQLDDGSRGFSFRADRDGPLDMRMDQTRGMTAAAWLAEASERDIKEVIRDYGEERFAGQIAKAIVAARARGALTRTGQLAGLVGAAVRTREPGQDPATRTFQAIRIHINQELAELQIALPQALDVLRPDGRLVVISFHSLEDRIAKRFIESEAHPERSVPGGLPLRADELPQPRMRRIGRPVRPGAAEIAANPRARTAIMRVAARV